MFRRAGRISISQFCYTLPKTRFYLNEAKDMQVITRKQGESIQVGDDISVTGVSI
ncbi:MAG: carbon storage regulator [Zhongshania sp.]|nr:carbon storage regulator [Zhongshania sp.]